MTIAWPKWAISQILVAFMLCLVVRISSIVGSYGYCWDELVIACNHLLLLLDSMKEEVGQRISKLFTYVVSRIVSTLLNNRQFEPRISTVEVNGIVNRIDPKWVLRIDISSLSQVIRTPDFLIELWHESAWVCLFFAIIFVCKMSMVELHDSK